MYNLSQQSFDIQLLMSLLHALFRFSHPSPITLRLFVTLTAVEEYYLLTTNFLLTFLPFPTRLTTYTPF